MDSDLYYWVCSMLNSISTPPAMDEGNRHMTHWIWKTGFEATFSANSNWAILGLPGKPKRNQKMTSSARKAQQGPIFTRYRTSS